MLTLEQMHKRREKRWKEQGILKQDDSFLDWDTYEKVYAFQDGKCAICGIIGFWTTMTADHDHKTGLFRGVLCFNCNHHILATFEKNNKWKNMVYETLLEGYLEQPPYQKFLSDNADSYGFKPNWWGDC